MILSNEIVCAFHYKSYGAFLCEEFKKEKDPIISFVDLPTTEITEPLIANILRCWFLI
ncbi:hypothetical protein BOVMAS36_16310 [Streptococcus uberis]